MNDAPHSSLPRAPVGAKAYGPTGVSNDDHYLIVRGRGGLLDGEFVKVPLGTSITLGRGRRCGFSLKKSARYLLSSGSDRSAIRSRLAYRAVSRHHCSITFVSVDVAEVENHSRNGTLIDGQLIDGQLIDGRPIDGRPIDGRPGDERRVHGGTVRRVRLDDIRHKAHEIRLGRNGDVFDLEYGSLAMLPEHSISR